MAWDWEPGPNWGTPNGHIRYTSREQFLARHPGLLPLGGAARNANETVCTVRWRFFCDVMEDTNQPLTAIDGDVHFFSSPEPVFEEIGDAPCAVSPHNFAPAAEGLPGATLESHAKYSLYNGGWVYLADRSAAETMRRLTHEWVGIGWRKMPDGRQFFGDQGYLALLVERHGAHVIRHRGVNLGPWSANRYPVTDNFGEVLVGGQPLIAYHFQSLRQDAAGAIAQLADASYRLPDSYIEPVYAPYLRALGAVKAA